MLVEVTASKEGVGKSFVADRVRDFCQYIGVPAVIVRIDSASSLPKLQPAPEIYLKSEGLLDALGQQNADSSPFLRLMIGIEFACENGGVIIIDWGPGLQRLRRAFLLENRLGKILSGTKRSAVSIVVTTSEAHAMHQADEILSYNRKYNKNFRNILVYNHIAVDCDLNALTPASRMTHETELAPLAANVIRFDCPALEVQHRTLLQSCMLPMTSAIQIHKNLLANQLQVSIEEAGSFQSALRKYWDMIDMKLAAMLGVDTGLYFSIKLKLGNISALRRRPAKAN